MRPTHPAFTGFIGQKAAISKLSFKIRNSNVKGGMIRPLLFGGPKGMGKTEVARLFGKALKKADGSPRHFIEINSSTVKKTSFFDYVYPAIQKLSGSVVFFDECHKLDNAFITVMLTALNSDKSPVRKVGYNNNFYEFDLREVCFSFATTEFDKLFPPLRDRLDKIDFVPYTQEELAQIMVGRMSPDLTFSPKVLAAISGVLRGNPRSAVQMAEDLQDYADESSLEGEFKMSHWLDVRNELSILPHGLSGDEIEILKCLTRGPSTLRGLEAFTGQSRSAIQRDLEVNLVRLSLIRIGQDRTITPMGLEVLRKIDSGIW